MRNRKRDDRYLSMAQVLLELHRFVAGYKHIETSGFSSIQQLAILSAAQPMYFTVMGSNCANAYRSLIGMFSSSRIKVQAMIWVCGQKR